VTTPAVPPAVDAALAASLRGLLATQLRRLRRRFLWHGLAVVAAAAGALTLLFFALDRLIGMPLPIRLFHTAVVAAACVYGVMRFVRYPLARPFSDDDLAVWFERTFPALSQRLVSALQLQAAMAADGLRDQSRAMIDELLRETADTVQALPLRQLIDARPTARVGAVALAALALLVAGALSSPTTATAFVRRHLGADVGYPRATTLRIELPSASAELQRVDRDDETELTLPAGGDLHVSVLAEGLVPREVFLDVRPLRDDDSAKARSVAAAPRPGDRFRHVFRRVSGAFEFRARGGDDDRGDRRVIVRTVLPPQVATIAAAVAPPAYAGAAAAEQKGGAIEALVGSGITITVTATAPVASATMVFLETGRRLELATEPADDGAVHYCARFALEASDRYQIELVGQNGLRNPNPGVYPLVALQDYAPIGRWLLPDDEGLLLLPGALLCVRVEGRDDFGLTAIDLQISHAGAPPQPKSLFTATADGSRTLATVPTALLEVKDLLARAPAPGTAAPPAEGGDGLVLMVTLRDGKQPQANATDLPRRIVQIVDEPQLAAAIARSFRGLREDVAQALDIQQDRAARLDELLAEGAAAGDFAQQAPGLEVGQGRVRASLERAHRGLMRAFDLHLWNRLETSQNAARVVDLYVERSAGLVEGVALDPAFYREVQQRRVAGTIGELERCLDPILAMLTLADGAASATSDAIARALAESQVAKDETDRRAALVRAGQGQRRLVADLNELLLRLQDWNDYQDLVQDVRSLRDRQRDLQDRIQDVRDKK